MPHSFLELLPQLVVESASPHLSLTTTEETRPSLRVSLYFGNQLNSEERITSSHRTLLVFRRLRHGSPGSNRKCLCDSRICRGWSSQHDIDFLFSPRRSPRPPSHFCSLSHRREVRTGLNCLFFDELIGGLLYLSLQFWTNRSGVC